MVWSTTHQSRWTVWSEMTWLRALPDKILNLRLTPGQGKCTTAHFQTVLHLKLCSLTFQVLWTLNTLKSKQKASLEEGKYIFSYRFVGGSETGGSCSPAFKGASLHAERLSLWGSVVFLVSVTLSTLGRMILAGLG